jgi:hypothetical protein
MRKILISLLAAAAVAAPAIAHHSFAMFDPARVVTLNGTVKEFRWVNPHVSLFVLADHPGAAPDLWSVELTSPGNLTRLGWARKTINPGDKVVVEVNHRDAVIGISVDLRRAEALLGLRHDHAGRPHPRGRARARGADSSVASAVTRSHSLTRRLAMPVKRTGVSLNAASTASVGTASCICDPSISAGRCGKLAISRRRTRIGLGECVRRRAEIDRAAGQRFGRPEIGRGRCVGLDREIRRRGSRSARPASSRIQLLDLRAEGRIAAQRQSI